MFSTLLLSLFISSVRCTNPSDFGCERTGTPTNIINPIKSARLRTVQSFSFTYGRVEVRAKMPAGDWLWPGNHILNCITIYYIIFNLYKAIIAPNSYNSIVNSVDTNVRLLPKWGVDVSNPSDTYILLIFQNQCAYFYH